MKKNEWICKNILEVLPYIKVFNNKTILIKYSGSVMNDKQLKESAMLDITLLKYVGIKPVIIHGGGIEISQTMEKIGKKPEFIDGLRVTDSETMDIVEMVLGGKVNKRIVSSLNKNGCKAVGITGKDADTIKAVAKKPIEKTDVDGNLMQLSLGYVGEVTEVNTELIELLIQNDYIPVIAPIGVCENGYSLNVNADVVAFSVASKLKVEKLIFMSDVDGVMKDLNNPDSLIRTVNASNAKNLIKTGIIKEGMIPKIDSCISSLKSGVKKVHIINGKIEHSLLLEIFTNEGIGTEIIL
jgi:acetylglutamate kinase